ncbi:MAG: protein kinase [Gemmatimonadota bacterium]|nr:protein kinase [Gemmatimonadota bacterium]
MTDAAQRLSSALADRYRLERELGQGGMATVYLAEDLKHRRKVAVKVLRPELAAVIGADRFVHEIRTVAALQHPHILGLIDSGEVQGTAYYVMPFVEGESLRDRLAREKQLPVTDAVRVATEVAGALDYAHRHGVIHRDIKPENILLHDGSALVADFGIALAVSSAGGTRMTETGMSLGTPHYMSPEQAMGEREITARSDVYALGVVLYEMLTGDPPFTGSTAQAIVARVVTEEPRSITAQRRTVPAHVEDAALVALAKLPADRFATAAEFAAALAGEGTGLRRQTPPGVRAGADPRWRRAALALGGLLAIAVAVGGWSLWRGRPAVAPRIYRFEVFFPASEQFAEAPGRVVAMAPDGSGFVYVGVGPSSARRLYYRRFDRLTSVPLEGTEDGEEPFFSPDGEWVGFRTGSRTSKVRLAGGPAEPLAAIPSRFGAWLADGTLVFSSDDAEVIVRVPAGGGAPDTLAGSAGAEGYGFWSLSPVPGGRFLLVQVTSQRVSQVALLDMERRHLETLTEGQAPTYAPSGHIVFRRDDGLMALDFDARTGRVTGEARRVLAAEEGAETISDFGLSADGSLIVLGRDALRRSLVEVDRAGRVRPLTAALRGYDSPRYAPDGARLAVRERSGGAFNIVVHDLRRGTNAQLSLDQRLNYYPEWWPDGRRVFWVRNNDRQTGLWSKAADGSGGETMLYDPPQNQYEAAVTRDGRWLVVRQNDSVTGRDLWLVRLPDGTATPLLRSPASEHNPKLSPDGRYLAYVSNVSGRGEVYVRTFPDSGGTWVVSRGGGAEPAWSASGRELFYRVGDAIVAVPVETRPTFTVGRADTLFTGMFVPNANHTNFDVHPDGQRFVMVGMATGERRALVVLNWVAELARGAPGR